MRCSLDRLGVHHAERDALRGVQGVEPLAHTCSMEGGIRPILRRYSGGGCSSPRTAYHRPEGVFFGGAKLCQSNVVRGLEQRTLVLCLAQMTAEAVMGARVVGLTPTHGPSAVRYGGSLTTAKWLSASRKPTPMAKPRATRSAGNTSSTTLATAQARSDEGRAPIVVLSTWCTRCGAANAVRV